MENPTSFDLTQAMAEWRQRLAESPAFRREDLDELEGHVRDSVAALEAKGLTAQEAFWLACHRLGTGHALQKEFVKVNTGGVWMDRAVWMLVGSIAVGALVAFSSTTRTATVLGLILWTPLGSWAGPAGLLLQPMFLVGALVLALHWFRRSEDTIDRFGRWAREHPIYLLAVLIGIIVAQGAVSNGIQVLMLRGLPVNTIAEVVKWAWPSALVCGLLPHFLLVWLLFKQRRIVTPVSQN